MKEFESLKEATEFVLFIQDAVNAGAIVRDFPRVVEAIGKFDPQNSTDDDNSHPLMVLMLDKLVQLAGGSIEWSGEYTMSKASFRVAYAWAQEQVK